MSTIKHKQASVDVDVSFSFAADATAASAVAVAAHHSYTNNAKCLYKSTEKKYNSFPLNEMIFSIFMIVRFNLNHFTKFGLCERVKKGNCKTTYYKQDEIICVNAMHKITTQ